MYYDWCKLTQAVNKFKQQLMSHSVVSAVTRVSVILFNDDTSVVSPTHARPAEISDIGHHQAGGGTNFCRAFHRCAQVMASSPSYAHELILLFTDGQANSPEREVRALLADHGARIKSFKCVAFGAGAGVQNLEAIGALFKEHGATFDISNPSDEASLVQTFVNAAANSHAIHMGK